MTRCLFHSLVRVSLCMHGGSGGSGPSSAGVCYAFQRGECTRGDDCRFRHEAGDVPVQQLTRPNKPDRSSRPVGRKDSQRGGSGRGRGGRTAGREETNAMSLDDDLDGYFSKRA